METIIKSDAVHEMKVQMKVQMKCILRGMYLTIRYEGYVRTDHRSVGTETRV